MTMLIAVILSISILHAMKRPVTIEEHDHNEDLCFYGDKEYANAFSEAFAKSEAMCNKRQTN